MLKSNTRFRPGGYGCREARSPFKDILPCPAKSARHTSKISASRCCQTDGSFFRAGPAHLNKTPDLNSHFCRSASAELCAVFYLTG